MTFEDLYAPSLLINIGIYENETLVETVVFHKRDKNLQVQNTGHRSQVQIIAQLINN